MRKHAGEWVRWAAMLAVIVGLFRLAHWNEYESSWGRATQAWKEQRLIERLCK